MLSSSLPSPQSYPHNVIFTVKLTDGDIPENRSVKFYNNTTLLGSGTIDSSGVATYPMSPEVGNYSIQAVFEGDENNEAAYSNTLSYSVSKGKLADINPDTIEYKTINDGILGEIGRFLTFGNFFKESVRVTVNVTDMEGSNAGKLYYAANGIAFSGNSLISNGKAVFDLTIDQIKNATFSIEIYAMDQDGNESNRLTLKGSGTNSATWYFSNDAPIISDFMANDAPLIDGQTMEEILVTMTTELHDNGGIYKISYKMDNLTDYVEVTDALGADGVLVKDYTFKQIFNSSGKHNMEVLVENNAGETSVKTINFEMLPQENARQITITAARCDYFEGEEINISDLKYSVSGLTQNENISELLDTSQTMVVIDDKAATGETIVLPKGRHTLSFANIYSLTSNVVYTEAEIMIHEKFTVKFDGDGGTTLQEEVSAQNGQLLNIPEEPSKAGYGFVGWSLEPKGETLWDFAYDTVNSDMVLYAVWSDNNYSVIIKNNNGSEDVIYSSVPYGKLLEQPEDPALEGSSFMGWYTDIAFTQPWNFTSNQVEQNTTIYARFSKQTFTVNFAAAGTQTPKAITGIYYDQLVRPIPEAPVSNSKLFAGWYLDKELEQSFDFAFDTVKSDITLYPKWVDKTYTVFGGVADSAGNLLQDAKVEIFQNEAKLAETSTDKNGLFRFVQVPTGQYSIVATDNTKNTTIELTVTDQDIMQLVITLPNESISKGVVSSDTSNRVTVDDVENILDSSEGSMLTVMDQRALRNGGRLEVNVLVSEQSKVQADKIDSMKEFANSMGKITADFCDISVEKLVYDNQGNAQKGYISETDKTISIRMLLSEEARNKNNYAIIREHNGELQLLTTEPVNGEYFEVADNEIIIHTKKFSSFAVSFDEMVAPNWAWLLIIVPVLLLLSLLYVKNKSKNQERGGK